MTINLVYALFYRGKGEKNVTIKKVEEQLGLSRATIRFYEREKLFIPQRSGNSYREYSEEDIAVLKKIVILRKLGFSVSEIKDFLEQNVPLQELLEKNILELQEKMNELNGAIKICKKMQSRQEDFDSFNESYYWEEIQSQEQAGSKFLEIVNDSIGYEKQIFYKYFSLLDFDGNMCYDKKEIIQRVLKTFCILGVFWFLFDGLFQEEWSIESFLRGLMQPILVLGVWSLFGLPWYLFKKKCPELAREYGVIGYAVVVTMLTIALLVILGFVFLTE